MIYTAEEYCIEFPYKGRTLSPRTIRRRCEQGLLPSHHHVKKLSSGDWIIEVPDELPQIKATKIDPPKPDIRKLSRSYFNLR